MGRRSAFFRIACSDGCIAVTLLLAAAASGVFYLFVQPGGQQNPLYIDQMPGDCNPNLVASVMIATGRGFSVPLEGNDAAVSYPDAPELSKFLRREVTCLSPGQIPEDLRTCKPRADWEYRHRFLVYTVGGLWSIFGISWRVVAGLRIAMFCAMIGAIYGLMRLGMGRLCSVAATLALAVSPLIVGVSINVRDFGKGPFILGAMLIVGFLIKHPVKRTALFGLSAVLGLVIGVGFGFRADVLMCLPPALFALAFCRRAGTGAAIGERMAAMGLLLVPFLMLASQIAGVYGGGSLFAHDVLMGIATKADDMLGMNRASYEKLYIKHDLFVAAMAAEDHNRSIPAGALPAVSTDERPLLMHMARTFPGDLVTRGYSSVLWVLRGGRPFVPYAAIMAVCAAAALLAVASADLRTACMTLMLLLYFCGYISLQPEVRHAFHLVFIPVWILGFLADKLLRAALWAAVAVSGRSGEDTSRQPWTVPARRMLQFSVFAVALLTVPLYSARAIQDATFGRLLDAYKTPDLVPIEVKARPMQDWTMFERAAAAPMHSGLSNPPKGFNIEYWVAEFAPSPQWRAIWLQYARGAVSIYDNWFSHGLWVAPGGTADSGNTLYFFPVVEQTRVSQGGWALFAGIGVPKDQAGDFRGLYKVRNTKDYPFLLNLSWPSVQNAFVPRQTLFGKTTGKLDADKAQDWLGRMPLYRIPPPNTVLPENETAELIKAYRDGLATAPDNALLRLGLAACLEPRADKDSAAKSYREALQADPGFFVTYHYIDDFLKRRGKVADRIALWTETASAHPENYLPQFHLALALEENRDADGALEAYRKVLAINPTDSATLGDIGRVLAARNDLRGAIEACRRALQIEPLDLPTVYSLQEILKRGGGS